uniref:Retrovirus-related Pol polyprotein from transposon TNT 1-94 n=1 Tax=Tanacetum cinerariifolium TaxID=118510 RepID=A0A6L2LW61_TANCI|nr:retrovirus-related Pol polyprotein from transposon TNT 1-94 [Tanacetum cinerariifolium]
MMRTNSYYWLFLYLLLTNTLKIIEYGNGETLLFDDVKSTFLSKQKFDDDVEPESGEGQVARGRSSDRGNHSLCYVVRKGNIQVKRHNGVVRTITGVRHIPDFKRNLISLSTLEANGCKYSGEDGVMKVFMGALVLMKAIQSGGLYVLQDDVFPTFKEWKVLIENQSRTKIKKLRIDNGLEFCRESFNALCHKYGIARNHTLVRTPQQNKIAERINMTMVR